jgi:signal peptidase I
MPLHWIFGLVYQAAVFVTSLRVTVVGWSMYPTLKAGEYVLFNRLAYLRSGPKRGDVIMVRRLLEGKKAEIKRVVGVHGDTVKLGRGILTVNDIQFGEASSLEGQSVWILKEDECFLLGDVMDMSTDSRSFGPVAQEAIKARAWLVCWPLSHWRSLHEE